MTVSLVHAWQSPCTSYEPNIYSATPIIFWFGLGCCYLVGISLTLIAAFRDDVPRFISYLGYFQIILASVSLMALHVIRGYKLLNISGDTGTHIGRLNSILSSGYLPETYYPNIYLEPAIFSELSGIGSDMVLQLFPVFSLFMFTVGICILSNRVFPHKEEVYFSRLIAFLLPCGSAMVVSSYSLLYGSMNISNLVLLPIFIFLVILNLNGNKLSFLSLTIVGLSTVFYHPHVAIMVLAISVAALFIAMLHRVKHIDISVSSILKLCVPFAVTLFGFFVYQWPVFHGLIMSGINKVFGVLFKEGPAVPPVENPNINPSSPPSTLVPDATIPVGGDAVDIGSTITQPPIELNFIDNILASIGDFFGVSAIRTGVESGYSIDTVFQIAGINIFVYGMLLVAGCIFLWKYMKDEQYFYLKFVYLCAVAMLPLIIVSIIMGDSSGGWGRFKLPIYIVALLSCGFVLYRLYLKITSGGIKNTAMRLGSIFIILSLVCGMSVYAFHPSPNTLSTGYQTTQAELTGAETLLPLIEYDFSSTTGVHFSGMQRYVIALYNHLNLPPRDDTAYDDGLPYHFGYDKGSSSITENIRDGEKYVIVIEKDLEHYQAYYPQMMQYRYEPDDYNHLDFDVSINYMYNNGGFSVYDLYLRV